MRNKVEGGLRVSGQDKQRPRLTIITICFNDLGGLQLTADSVKSNISGHLEYLVIDGGSTDGTVEFLSGLGFVDYWVSEQDRGIYDAMSKGARLARGEGLLFLNAGDYIEGTIGFERLRPPCFLPVWYRDPLGRFRQIPLKSATKGMPNCHQGVVFENKGLEYNTGFRIAADFDYFLQHGYDEGLPMADVEGYVVFDSSGVSSTRLSERDKEIETIIRQRFGLWHGLVFRLSASLKRALKLLIKRVKL